jgi:hypothetical protein
MLARAGRCLGVLSVLLLLSCAQLPRPLREAEGGIPTETLKDLTSVPREWGNLVSVTTPTTRENVSRFAQLWFQDSEGNVRVVAFDAQTSRLMPTAGIIRRK